MCTPISLTIGPKANISVFIFHLEFVLFYIFLGSNSLFIGVCLTMLCWFLLFKEVNQLHGYIYPLPHGPPAPPPPPSQPSRSSLS